MAMMFIENSQSMFLTEFKLTGSLFMLNGTLYICMTAEIKVTTRVGWCESIKLSIHGILHIVTNLFFLGAFQVLAKK